MMAKCIEYDFMNDIIDGIIGAIDYVCTMKNKEMKF
ncbi:MAG: hypothetical protein CM15mP19_00140 [Gammaproteobacteria bacterium]|nr:MAG: hypothetical protein CM15mP19_00140 [Gammaproteobacteria bacterium]